VEFRQKFRPILDIDYDSAKVIQCGGDLAQLENDDTVRSIGRGNTDKLSTFFTELEALDNINNLAKAESLEESEDALTENGEIILDQLGDQPVSETGDSEEKISPDLQELSELPQDVEEPAEAEYDDDDFDDEDAEMEDAEVNSSSAGQQAAVTAGGIRDGNVQIEQSAFGRKVRKRKKKMETRLLKEILNDVKVSSKRH
jgi:hypothetical protein